jgi:hypothetical protein
MANRSHSMLDSKSSFTPSEWLILDSEFKFRHERLRPNKISNDEPINRRNAHNGRYWSWVGYVLRRVPESVGKKSAVQRTRKEEQKRNT